MQSLSDKRLIVQATVNGRQAPFLLDTGASVGLMDDNQAQKYGLKYGRPYHGQVIGAAGTMTEMYYSGTMAQLEGRTVPQFLIADIGAVVDSIRRETGIEVLGIISLPQMSLVGINIDVNSHEITLE